LWTCKHFLFFLNYFLPAFLVAFGVALSAVLSSLVKASNAVCDIAIAASSPLVLAVSKSVVA
jgi:hypothetical protein